MGARPEGGRCFEDFEAGQIVEHELGRTITPTDNIWFTLLTMNTNPMHFDAEYSKATTFGKPLVNSCFTLALVTGLSAYPLELPGRSVKNNIASPLTKSHDYSSATATAPRSAT